MPCVVPPRVQASSSSALSSKLHLVDLAGSERTKRSGVAAHGGSGGGGGAGGDGGAQRFREAVNINQVIVPRVGRSLVLSNLGCNVLT